MPEWVEKFRKKGVQITRQKDNYYLYKTGCKYDPKTKKYKKTTEEYLGKITPSGVIPPKHKRSNLINLKKNDKSLRNLQIIKELNEGKKIEENSEKITFLI